MSLNADIPCLLHFSELFPQYYLCAHHQAGYAALSSMSFQNQ